MAKQTKKFKTETKRLLELMIHSIYTNKEVFLRELLSNASDALDKRRFLALTNNNAYEKDLKITVIPNKELRTIEIIDNGIGMNKDDLETNIGTVAKSGTKEFLDNLDKEKYKSDAIGQFGVGFYSSFIVADKVMVETKKVLEDKAYKFTSDGLESYTIEEIEKEEYGTKITLFLREDTEEVNYSKFLEEFEIVNLIKKYSDYITYPIETYKTKTEEEKEISELTQINEMKPIWQKSKKELTDKEIYDFYKSKFADFQDPLSYIHLDVEGMISYKSLLYIPNKSLFFTGNEHNERGLQLYSKGVFILDKCKQLIPEYLYFVKGIVDSSDLPLNISREILQEDHQIKKIAKNIEKRILKELERMLKNDREKYLEFYKAHGVSLKYGAQENFGLRKKEIEDLLLFESYNEGKLITLDEYKSKMKEGQNDIYFISAKTKRQAEQNPKTELVIKKGYDVLIMQDDVDEFLIQALREYNGKNYKNINSEDLDIFSEEEKKEFENVKEENKDLIAELKEILKDEVQDVVITNTIKDVAGVLSTKEGLTIQMQKVIEKQNPFAKAQIVLELNPEHKLFRKLKEEDKDKKKEILELILNEAKILAGVEINNPKEFILKINELL